MESSLSKPHVYISYSRDDGAQFAEKLELVLKQFGIPTWRDVRNIDPFQDFTAEIERNIEFASHVVVCITPDTKRGDSFVRREIQFGLLSKKPIIPLRFADIIPQVSLVNFERLDGFVDWTSAIARLLELLSKPMAQPATIPDRDSFRSYVEELYARTVAFLQQSVISLVDLQVEDTPDAVSSSRRADMLTQFFVGQGLQSEDSGGIQFKRFRDAFERFGNRVLLLGTPGSGKTITLMSLARDAAVARLSDPEAPLPLLGLIPTWDAVRRPSLEEWLSEGYAELSTEQVTHVIMRRQALLLLDGLDELGNEQIVWEVDKYTGERRIKERFDPRPRFISIIPPINQVLVTCRVRDYSELNEKLALNGAVTLQQLSDEQITQYLHNQPALAAAIQRDDQLREMLRTPLLMSLFAFAYRDLAPEDSGRASALDTSPGELRDRIISRYIQKRFEWEARKHRLLLTLEQFSLQLGRIAFEDAARAWGRNRISGMNEELAEMGLRLNILIRTSESERDWEEVSLFGRHPPWWERRQVTVFRFIHLLIRDYFAYQAALTISDHQYSSLHEQAIKALMNLPDPRARVTLLKFLAKRDFYIRHFAISSVTAMSSDYSRELFCEALRNSDPVMRESIAEVIGRSRRFDLAADVAAIGLADPDKQVRSRSAHALGKLAYEPALAALINLLQDPDQSVRGNATYAIAEIGDDRAREILSTLVDNRDPLVRINARDGLLRINHKKIGR